MCPQGHEWKAVVNSRARGMGCPYCAGQKPTAERNFATKYPELVEESLDAVKGRALKQDICATLMGRGEQAWAPLLADARYARAQADLAADVGPLA